MGNARLNIALEQVILTGESDPDIAEGDDFILAQDMGLVTVEDGTLDMDTLLREFQKFWRRHSEIWEEKADYTEAFLQRVVNGG